MLRLLNEFYPLVRLRLNIFTATTKAVGWRPNKHGKNTGVNDTPASRTGAAWTPASSPWAGKQNW
jgi:hypothetical protein